MIPLRLCFQCEQAAAASLGRCQSNTFAYVYRHNNVLLTAGLEDREVTRWHLLVYRDNADLLIALVRNEPTPRL